MPARDGLEEGLALAGDQRVHRQAQFVDQAEVDEARGRARAADDVDGLAGLALQGMHFGDVAQQAGVAPRGGGQRLRQHVVRGVRREARVVDFGGGRHPAAGHLERLGR